MRFDVREQYAAQFGEVRSAALDLEQSDAEMVLESGDGVTDGRLGAVELFGRRRETAHLDDGLQDLPLGPIRISNDCFALTSALFGVAKLLKIRPSAFSQ